MKVVFYDRMDNDGRGALAVFNRYAIENDIDYIAHGLDRDMKIDGGKHYINILIELLGEQNYIDEVVFMDLAPRTITECDVVWYLCDVSVINLKIIDHHKLHYSIGDVCEDITYVHEIGKSACMLAWEHYFQSMEAPRVVELINDRDVWANDMQPYTNYLYNTFGMMKQVELDELIKSDNNEMLNKWLAIGEIREELIVEPTIQNLVDNCEVVEWNSYKIAVPRKDIAPEYVSEVGNKACKQYACDFFCYVYPKGNSWGYGLRSLGGQALKFIRDNNFKGGGHHNACGFTHEEKLF